jgi:beta-glucosidase
VKRLVGFRKVELNPGSDSKVSVSVDPRLLAQFDVKKQRWHVAAGQYHIVVGASSADSTLAADTNMLEQWLRP